MKSILHKQTTYLIIAVLFFCASVFGALWFLHNMQQKSARVVAVKEQVASYQENKKIFAEESKQLKSLSDHTKELEAKTITPATTPDLLSSLEKLAQSNYVDFAITSVQTPEANTEAAKLIIDFSAKGALAALDGFLAALEHQQYQIRINHFSLHRDMTLVPDGLPVVKGKGVQVPRSAKWELVVSMQIMSY